MANQPFDLEVIQPRERPLSSDIDLISSYGAAALKELLAQLCLGSNLGSSASTPMVPTGCVGFLGTGFTPAFGSGLTITLQPGLGFMNNGTPVFSVGDVAGLNDLGNYRALSLTAVETITVPAANPSNGRYDIIEVSTAALLTDTTSRDVLDTTTGIFVPSPLAKTLTVNCNGRSTVNSTGPINYKTGTPAGSPVPPNPDSGYVTIAQVYVPAAASSFNNGSVTDFRRLIYPGGNMQAMANFHIDASNATASLNRAIAPAGMSMAIQYTGFAGLLQASVILWPVATNALGLSLPATLQRQATGSPNPVSFVDGGVTSFAIGSTQQSQLNAMGFAIGPGTIVLESVLQGYAMNTAYPGSSGASGAAGYGSVFIVANNDLGG